MYQYEKALPISGVQVAGLAEIGKTPSVEQWHRIRVTGTVQIAYRTQSQASHEVIATLTDETQLFHLPGVHSWEFTETTGLAGATVDVHGV